MKTRLVSIEQIGSVDNGEIVAVLSGEGFHQAEFDDMLRYLQGEGRGGNVANIHPEYMPNRVKLTFTLKGVHVSEQMSHASMEGYLKFIWCPKRDRIRRSQAC